MFSIIAAVGKNNELGKKGGLVFNIKEDMKFFKETTMGHPVLMGLTTFESIGRALPGRKNYVLTRNPESLPEDVTPITDLEKFIKDNLDTDEETDLAVSGVFEAIGLIPDNALFADLAGLDEKGYILTDDYNKERDKRWFNLRFCQIYQN